MSIKYPYYNPDYLQKISEWEEEKKLKKALKHYEIYLKDFPYDLNAYTSFANLLIKFNRLEEAKNILEKIKDFPNYSGDRLFFFIKHIHLKILCAEGKYQEAYDFQKQHPELLPGTNYFEDVLFLSKKVKEEFNCNKNNYLFQQILNYNEEEFFKHVKKHQIESEDKEIFTFLEDFFIKDVYYQIRKLLPNKNRLLISIYADRYYFKYDNCGYRKDRNTDYFTAVVLHDSNEIITMYPCSIDEVSTDFIDLNPYFKKEEKEYTRTKRMSQIEKFNQKYGK